MDFGIDNNHLHCHVVEVPVVEAGVEAEVVEAANRATGPLRYPM